MKKILSLVAVLTIMNIASAQNPSIVKDSNGNPLLFAMVTLSNGIYVCMQGGLDSVRICRYNAITGENVVLKSYSKSGITGTAFCYSGDYYHNTAINGKAYFTFTVSLHRDLYVSDGTADGTFQIGTMQGSSGVTIKLVELNDIVYFTDDNSGPALWRTDGSMGGTYIVSQDSTHTPNDGENELIAWNGAIYFQSGDDAHGKELWASDGSAQGTFMLKNINAGSASSAPRTFTVYNGILYFMAFTHATGNELWRTDGTTGGTFRVRDIQPGPGSSYPDDLTVYKNHLYFEAYTKSHGVDLWRTDGTATGTELFSDLGPTTSLLTSFTIADSLLFFAHGVKSGYRLSFTDGTPGPVSRVKGTGRDMQLNPVVNVNGDLYYIPFHQFLYNLWRTNGTPCHTDKFNFIPGESDAVNISHVDSNLLYFYMKDTSIGETVLWKLITQPIPSNDCAEKVIGNPSNENANESESPLTLYPNPVTSSSTIEFRLTNTSPVLIEIYDVTGKKLKTLLNEGLSEGAHQLTMDRGDMMDGIYFIRMTTAEGQRTEKLVVQ